MSDKTFHLQAWNPQTHVIADDLIRRIQEIAPELEVLFMGSAALKLSGKNDVDLDILCDKENIRMYADKLVPVLGEPRQMIDNDFASWSFYINDTEIDCFLSDPTISHVPAQKAMFEKFQQHPELRQEFLQLKKDCDCKPYEEYEKCKKEFFDQHSL